MRPFLRATFKLQPRDRVFSAASMGMPKLRPDLHDVTGKCLDRMRGPPWAKRGDHKGLRCLYNNHNATSTDSAPAVAASVTTSSRRQRGTDTT